MIANAVDQSAQMDDVSELTNELRKLGCSCRLEARLGVPKFNFYSQCGGWYVHLRTC